MIPTAEQIEQVMSLTGTLSTQQQWGHVRRVIEVWEQVCPRPKSVKMSECRSIARDAEVFVGTVQAAAIVEVLAKRGHLTIEDKKGGE